VHVAHSATCNKCVNAPCEQCSMRAMLHVKKCSKADARHADAVVSFVIMILRHTAWKLLAVVVCCSACQDRKRMAKNFVISMQNKVAAARGHLGFKLSLQVDGA